MSQAYFEESFLGRFFPWELKETKVREFLKLKKDSLSVHEYGLKSTQLFLYVPKMFKDSGSTISLFFGWLAHSSSQGSIADNQVTWTYQGWSFMCSRLRKIRWETQEFINKKDDTTFVILKIEWTYIIIF